MSSPRGEPGTPPGISQPEISADPALLQGLVRLLASHPGLLLEHVRAHASLLVVEWATARARLERQALWWAGALTSAVVAATLAGAALLQWLSRPGVTIAEAPGELAAVAGTALSPWLLAAVPAAPLLLALLCTAGGLGWLGRRRAAAPGWLARFESDLAALQEARR